jgi:hypothetical protein
MNNKGLFHKEGEGVAHYEFMVRGIQSPIRIMKHLFINCFSLQAGQLAS